MDVEWRNLRADELRALAVRDAIVIVPVASMEQHGPHLPVAVDTVLGEAVAVRTAHKIVAGGEAAVALPVVWTGLSEHHMSFGGTITLDFPAFAALIEGVCRSLVRHGFRRIVLSNSHGGNENALRTLADELTVKLGVPLVQFTYWYVAAPVIAAILEAQTGLNHACEAETSMMMALRPDLVARERIPPVQTGPAPETDAGLYRWRAIAARSASGALGHPEAATAAKGERLLEAITDTLAEKLSSMALWRLPWRAETGA